MTLSTFRDQNSIARVQNSRVAFVDRSLAILVNPSTGENIPNFPNTGADLSRMQTAAVNRVLAGLGLPVDGELDDRRNRIRIAIGLQIGRM